MLRKEEILERTNNGLNVYNAPQNLDKNKGGGKGLSL